MNYKVILFLLLLPSSVAMAAEKVNTDNAEKVFDYTTCSTFFAVLANNMGDNAKSIARFNRMSEQMLDYAISLDSDGYKGINEDDVAKKLQEEMQKSEESAKNVVRLYAPHCQKLLQEINPKKETPKK